MHIHRLYLYMLSIKRLLFETGKTQSEIGEILNLPQSAVSNMANGFRQVRPEHIVKLRAAFGDEMIARCTIPDEEFNPHAGARTVQATILPASVVEDIKAELSQPKAEDVEVVEAVEVPYVPEDLAAKPNTNVRELVCADKVDRVNVMDLLGSFDFVQPVFRQAMAPLYNRGDLLFLRYLPLGNGDTIPDGEYMVDTMKYGSMLGHVHDEGDGSFTISYVNPLYSPLNIRKEDAASIAVVVNHLRAGGSSMDYDMVRMLNVKETQLSDALRIIEKSGDRADRLIEQFLLKKNN